MSEPSKVEVDNFADESQDLNDSKINGWTRRSLKEGLCGILNCYNKSTS